VDQIGSDIEAKDILGATPLHRASETNTLEVVQILLKPGAKMYDQQDSKGTATFVGKRKSRGADVHSKDNEGSNASVLRQP
jgi:ankyrin repeat protein